MEDWVWSMADDAAAIHSLIEESDRNSANHFSPAPLRNFNSTIALVDNGLVHCLTIEDVLSACVTVTDRPPFDASIAQFSDANKHRYMLRLAVCSVATSQYGARPAVSAIRRVMEYCRHNSVDWLRCEINPQILVVSELMDYHGFSKVQLLQNNDDTNRAYREKQIHP